MNSVLKHVIAPSQPLLVPTFPLSPPLSRQRRDSPSAPQPEATTRAGGDAELATQYQIALHLAAKRQPSIEIGHIPAHSTFGQWWGHLHDAFQSPDVQQWIRTRGIDATSIQLDPKSGQVSFMLERYLDPSQTLHTVAEDDPHWAAIGEPIRQAARVMGVRFPFAPPVLSPSEPVPWQIVGDFYQEPQGLTLSGMLRRADQIDQGQRFKTLDPTRFASLITSRGEDALQDQKALLGDIRNRHRVGETLRRLATAIENGGKQVGEIRTELQKTVQLSADGTYWPTDAGNANAVSLQQLLEDHGWDIPTTSEQLLNLANALTTAPPKAAAHGDLGGALSWPIPLDQENQEQLRADIRTGKLGDIALSPFKTVLDYLLNGRPISEREQRNPRLLIDALVNSPRGQALGKAIQATFEARSVKGNATDWLLAAFNMQSNTPSCEGRTIEGYQLVSAENIGKTAAAVIKALAEYLHSEGIASSLETASVLAYSKVSSTAPEFHVKDIPDQVVVGTHSWVTFATAVARIEAKAPGATATMTYAQVILAASIAPITDEERLVEYAAQNQAIKEWAVANGKNYPSTDAALSAVRKSFDTQVRLLSEVAATPDLAMPTTNAIALEHLKTAFPSMDPTLFEKKCITSKPSNRHLPGPYSLLDLYIDGRALVGAPPDSNSDWGPARSVLNFLTAGGLSTPPDGTPAVWVSSSSGVKINEVLPKLKALARPLQQFKEDYLTYADAVKKTASAQLNYLISKQPQQHRENLEYGKITVRREIDYHRADHPLRVADGVLLIETERNSKTLTYEYDRLKGTLTPLPNKAYREYAPTDGYYPSKGKRYDVIKPSGKYAPGIADENKGAQGAPDSFGSARTQYIVDAVIEDMDLPAVQRRAKGATTFETEVPTYKIVQEIALALIPLRSAINNFKEGKVFDGAVDLAFDIFGFAVGLGAAAKGAKGALASASALSKVGKVFQIAGRAAVGALNPLGGVDDLARGAFKAGRFVVSKAHKGVKQLRAAYSGVNLLELAKNPNIVEGTFRAANSTHTRKALAKFDEESQQWFRIHPRTKEMYLEPLPNFIPDRYTPRDINSLQAIGSHDPVQAASQQYGLAATGTFKVGHEAVEGTVVMSQGSWHRYDALKKQPILPPVTHFTPSRVAANGEVRSLDADLLGYESKYVASGELSIKGLQGNVFIGRSKKEYVKVDGLLYESRLKDGQRVIRHPKGAGPDIPLRDLGTSGWEPAARSERLLGGASSGPVQWSFGNGMFAVPMDDIKITRHSATPFSLNYQGMDRHVTFNSRAGAWTETRRVEGTHEIRHTYYWRSGNGKWQGGTFDEFSNARKLDSKTYKLADISTPVLINIPKGLKPLPKQLHYFWAGKEIPAHLIDNITRNATRASGYTSILHVDADNPAIFQRIKTHMESKVPGVTVVNLHEDEAFKRVKDSELYQYFRQGEGQNLAAASDVARYPIMNKHGGVYLDTDDVIHANISSEPLMAGVNDVLLGMPSVHSLTDNKTFYNTSHFATRPGNPVLESLITEMNKRFTANKIHFPAKRPKVTRGDDGHVNFTDEFNAYEKKIFDTVGPNLFNDTLKLKRPDMYDLGIDGFSKQAKVVDGARVAHGPAVDIKKDVLEAYARNGIAAPDLLDNQIRKMKEHYFPLRHRFNVQAGSEHSWINT
ncbi:glycosyltransferase family 32 protein [Pseudomonas sp. 1152_12]|uniref:glycosyltransferase family 32 protein n=1 Tax=Pseudomonas sp. 1152_12 TaxID=2604455 RepID=UPI0040639432